MIDPSQPGFPVAGPRGHIAALDGVRGIAILAVVVFHCFALTDTHTGTPIDTVASKVTGVGWMGVDLFFVLSGFLITRILLDSRGGARYFSSFYARRVLRIFPVYYGFLFLLIVVIPELPHFRGSVNLADLRHHQLTYWTYTFNIVFARNPLDNWGTFSNAHLWSLMVEEQFYLVWPAVVFVLSRRNLSLACVACMIGAPLFRLLLLQGYFGAFDANSAAFTLMPARVDTLAAGALVAVLTRDERTFALVSKCALPLLAAALIPLLATFVIDDDVQPIFNDWIEVIGFSAAAACCAALIVMALTAAPGSLLSTVCSHRSLAFFGRYSYAIYVLHFQITWALAQRFDVPLIAGSDVLGRIGFTLVIVGVMAAIGWLSWHLYEKRFLSLKRFFPYGGAGEHGSPLAEPLTAAVAGIAE